jgi:uncharacterized membrane protein
MDIWRRLSYWQVSWTLVRLEPEPGAQQFWKPVWAPGVLYVIPCANVAGCVELLRLLVTAATCRALFRKKVPDAVFP